MDFRTRIEQHLGAAPCVHASAYVAPGAVLVGDVTLAASDRPVHHVFCTTDLQSGDPVFITPRLVSGYRLGFGTPGELPLSTAVQCSANLPGAFPPRACR